MSEALLIAVAPNGARRGKGDHPAIPLSIAEIAAEAAACSAAGAGMIHVHVRDDDGRHSLSGALYAEAIAAIRAAAGPSLVIQITTEAAGSFDIETQMRAVRECTPDAVSLALRELVPDANDEACARDFFAEVKQRGIAPQFILYAPDEIDRLRDLIDRGIVPFAAPEVLFVLGRYTAGQQSHPRDLLAFLNRYDLGGRWSVCAFGRAEMAVMAAAVALGGHVRVGFENNLHRPDGTLLANNAEQVARVAQIAALTGRNLMGK